jgi:signal transduction histidine kinase
MSKGRRSNSWVPPAWPVLVSLGLVAVLILGMIGIDLLLGQRVARRTREIIENSQRAVLLLDDVRLRVRRLVAIDLKKEEVLPLVQAIEVDVHDYDPLATYGGARGEWTTLRGLLHRLTTSPPGNPRARAELAIDIYRSINHLISLSWDEGRSNMVSIRDAHRQGLWGDAVVGGLTLILVSIICVRLLRVLARQRRLVAERVDSLSDRNNELDAFAGRAAHDLRSPMNPIRGYADLIIEFEDLPEEVTAMAQRIRKAVDRMARVVDDMLILSVSGRPPPGQCSPTAVVTALLEEMSAELHGIEVVTRLGAGRVACAESVLGQLLRNLIGNAIKFRARSRPLRIVLETRDVGGVVEIALEDNGVGMDPECARHAFEAFYRGQMDRELPGHGLGLAIVERTVHALNGTCELSSVPEQGTRIAVRIPKAA